LFFRVVSYRHQKGSIAITTNKSIRDALPEVLADDNVLAGAVLGRLLHLATVLNIQGRSYRLKDLETSVAQEASLATRDASLAPRRDTSYFDSLALIETTSNSKC
jgi:hypothetical protein